MEYSIYINREDANKAEGEELNAFIRSILESMGLDLEDVWDEGEELDAKTKLKLRKLLDKFEVEIIHDGDRGYNVYVGDDNIASWEKPRFILKQDEKSRTLSKRFFFEMIVKCSSVFEDEEGSESEEDESEDEED